VTAIPPWMWLTGAAALPILTLGLLAIGACIGGTKISREHARPVSDERDGTSFAPLDHDDATTHEARWDEEPAPGTGPRRDTKDAL
jgi:hypothetical protein